MCRGEMRSSLGVVKLGILRLRLSRGLDARGCRLLRRCSVMPWWRRGSYATNIESNIQNIKDARIGELKDFLKLFNCLASNGIHMIIGWLYLIFNYIHQERKRIKTIVSNKIRMVTLRCGCSPIIYRHWVCELFIKNLKIISISTNICKLYVCVPLGPYILIVNNFIDPQLFICQTY